MRADNAATCGKLNPHPSLFVAPWACSARGPFHKWRGRLVEILIGLEVELQCPQVPIHLGPYTVLQEREELARSPARFKES